ncbi:MAG: zinc-binding protein, partial [Deltaproteobacteria bacterium]|nr:zinc-binding protein [Deltaproteobacteria bacterium]
MGGCPMNSILDFFPAGQMKQKTAHEWCGPCLSCGGNDRFTVWPGRPGGGYYMCRGCDPQGGDGIQFLRKYMGMSYAEACAALGIEPKRTTTSSFPARRVHARTRPARPAQVAYVPPHGPEPAVLPCEKWMSSAAAFLADCQRDLETKPEALLAITGRFLTPYTAQDCGIGWNPADRYILRESWGLPVIEMADGGKRDKLLLPRGLTITTRREAGPAAVTIRCSDDRPEGRPKYWQVKGSSNVPFVAGRAGLPLLLVESALDAAL